MPYEFVDDIAVADIAFHAWGRDMEEAFRGAAAAMMNVMVEDLGTILPRTKRAAKIRRSESDMLLFDFLQELLYYKDAERLFLLPEQIVISREEGGYLLVACLAGEGIDPDRHQTRADVKAVTLHRFHLVKTDTGWDAMVILDI